MSIKGWIDKENVGLSFKKIGESRPSTRPAPEEKYTLEEKTSLRKDCEWRNW